jgi:Family of unknown function (DUF6328)
MMSKKLDSKLKTALDETRLLFLGGQVLLGFQFQAFFQDGFSTLASSAMYLSLGGVLLMVLSIALLVAPAMQHRLVEGGHASDRLLRVNDAVRGRKSCPSRDEPGAGGIHRDRPALRHDGRRHVGPYYGRGLRVVLVRD